MPKITFQQFASGSLSDPVIKKAIASITNSSENYPKHIMEANRSNFIRQMGELLGDSRGESYLGCLVNTFDAWKSDPFNNEAKQARTEALKIIKEDSEKFSNAGIDFATVTPYKNALRKIGFTPDFKDTFHPVNLNDKVTVSRGGETKTVTREKFLKELGRQGFTIDQEKPSLFKTPGTGQATPNVDQIDQATNEFQPINQLKNQGISQADPNAQANAGFINALYQEGFGRDATQPELDKFVGNSVKDASNVILGQQRSPFTGATSPITPPGDTTSPVASDTGVIGDVSTTAPPEDFQGLLDGLIANDPFLADQLKSPEAKAQFGALSPELQSSYLQLLRSLEDKIEAGEVINPDIEINPEQAAKFLTQAQNELDPFYAEQIGNIRQDLDTSFTRLQDDFDKGIRRAEDPFKQNLEAQAQQEADRGLAFSSGRQEREQRSVDQQQQSIDDFATQAQRNVQDASVLGERKLGSDVFGTIQRPDLQSATVGTQGFTRTPSRNLFTPQGELIGDIPKQRETAIRGRASELESTFRGQRNLDLNKL